jgi:hypothetical protein
MRLDHPAYSAKNAFMRLDKKFRSALSKRGSVRLDLIEELENEFREFFSHNPRGNWSKIITSNQSKI